MPSPSTVVAAERRCDWPAPSTAHAPRRRSPCHRAPPDPPAARGSSTVRGTLIPPCGEEGHAEGEEAGVRVSLRRRRSIDPGDICRERVRQSLHRLLRVLDAAEAHQRRLRLQPIHRVRANGDDPPEDALAVAFEANPVRRVEGVDIVAGLQDRVCSFSIAASSPSQGD